MAPSTYFSIEFGEKKISLKKTQHTQEKKFLVVLTKAIKHFFVGRRQHWRYCFLWICQHATKIQSENNKNAKKGHKIIRLYNNTIYSVLYLNYNSEKKSAVTAQGMYKNRVKNDWKKFEIPALLSCEQGNPEWGNSK